MSHKSKYYEKKLVSKASKSCNKFTQYGFGKIDSSENRPGKDKNETLSSRSVVKLIDDDGADRCETESEITASQCDDDVELQK